MSLKFLFIAPTPFFQNRGCHLRIRSEAQALQQKGHEVLIVTYKEGENLAKLKIKRSRFAIGKFGQGVSSSFKNIPNGIILFGLTLSETLKKRPDVLYCHLHEGISIGWAVKKFARIISFFKYNPILIFDGQGSLSSEMKESGMIKNHFILRLVKQLEKIILKFPDLIFISSRNFFLRITKGKMLANVFFLPDAISVFGVKKESLLRYDRTKEEKEVILTDLNDSLSAEGQETLKNWVKNEKVIVTYTGSFTRTKGFFVLQDKIMPHLKDNHQVKFLLGGGELKEKTENQNYLCVPNLNAENLKTLLLLSDIAIDPKPKNTTEASGKILNYMATALPVVCFKQPNNRFFLEENGYYTEKEEGFVELIERLAVRKEERISNGQKNLARAFSNFTEEVAAETIEREIREFKTKQA